MRIAARIAAVFLATAVATWRAAISGKILSLGRRSAGSRLAVRAGGCADGFAKGTTVATVGCGSAARCPALAMVVATRPFASFALVSGRGLILRPLGAEAEPLELTQIDFIKIRRRIFLRNVVVHGNFNFESGRKAREWYLAAWWR